MAVNEVMIQNHPFFMEPWRKRRNLWDIEWVISNEKIEGVAGHLVWSGEKSTYIYIYSSNNGSPCYGLGFVSSLMPFSSSSYIYEQLLELTFALL